MKPHWRVAPRCSEKFPLLFSVMSTGVTFVRAEEFSDLRTYEAPDVLRHVMGFGETPDKALTGPMQKLLDSGFIQAVRMCVDQVARVPARCLSGPCARRSAGALRLDTPLIH